MYTSSMLRDSMAVTHKIEPVTLEGRGLLVRCERTPLLKPPAPRQSRTSKDCEQPFGEEEATAIEGISSSRLVLIMGTVWLSIFLASLDSTIIATLSAPISSEFDWLSLLSWLATASLIANAAVQPIAGRLTDIFGRRLGLAVSNLFFAVGNLICGLSTNYYTMILGRVLAGIGRGGMISVATFLTSDLTPLRKRGTMQGIANVWYGAGAMLGAVIGGLIQDHTILGWRFAFFIQVPPSLLLIPAIWILVKVPCKESEQSSLERIDFLGVFFTVSFLVLLLLGLNAGGNSVAWTHPLPLTTLPLSLLAFAGFIWCEGKAKHPIIPARLLQDPTVLAACFASLFVSMVLMTSTFYLPLYFQVLGDSTSTAGLRFLPLPLGGVVGALGVGYVMTLTGECKRSGVLGSLALIAGTGILVFQDESSPVYLTCVALFFVGAGFSLVLTTATEACLAAVDHSQQALVTSAICELHFLSSRFSNIDANFYRRVRSKCGWHAWYCCCVCSVSAYFEGETVGSVWRVFNRPGRDSSCIEQLGGAGETSQRMEGGRYGVVHGIFPACVGDDGYLGFHGDGLYCVVEAAQAVFDDGQSVTDTWPGGFGFVYLFLLSVIIISVSADLRRRYSTSTPGNNIGF